MTAPSKKKPVIIVDSREQRPYAFSNRVIRQIQALPAGDYSLQGFENKAAIERKSLDDLVNTVVHERERFERELNRLKEYRFAWVVVEGTIEDIVAGNYRSGITPPSLLGIITSLMADFIPFVFAGDRVHAILVVEALLFRAHKRLIDA
jgi:ERCC4-type nuclease